MQQWKKLGCLFVPTGEDAWAKSHAMIPTPLTLDNGNLRIYYASVNEQMQGSISYLEVSPENPVEILSHAEKPVLGPGQAGRFDDNGVNPLCIVQYGEEVWMYYVGYQLGVQVRYFLFMGIAISVDGGKSFARKYEVPVIDRSHGESLVRSSGFIIPHNGGWRCWYVGGNDFIQVGDRLRPTYTLRVIDSTDGLNWPAEGKEVFPLREGEFGIGRPYVIKEKQEWRMWYSIRYKEIGYRLGYAESVDGENWLRKDEQVGIDVSSEGWDSEMIAYASIVPMKKGLYMFYNGNGYGQTGFGVAKLIEE
jgi:hypothetical protein